MNTNNPEEAESSLGMPASTVAAPQRVPVTPTANDDLTCHAKGRPPLPLPRESVPATRELASAAEKDARDDIGQVVGARALGVETAERRLA